MRRVLCFAALLTALSATNFAQVTTSCSITINDTLAYVGSKSAAFNAMSMNQINDGSNYGYAGYAQTYGAPDSVLVKGFCFEGFVFTGGLPTSVTYGLYQADGSGLPGTAITTGTVMVPVSSNSLELCVDFGGGYMVKNDYIITLQNLTSADVYVVRNNDGDGAAEDLALTYYKGVSDPSFDGWYKTFPFGTGWDFDVVINPVIEHTIDLTTTYTDALCLGDTTFVSVQAVYEDSVYASKFYNPNYVSFNGINEEVWLDYGDGSAITVDTNHVYALGGQYSITQNLSFATLMWNGQLVTAPCMGTVDVTDASFDLGADPVVCQGDVVYLSALGYDQYLWNNGSTNDSLVIDTDTLSGVMFEYYLDAVLGSCSASDTVVLSFGGVDVNLGNDTTVCLNQNVLLTAGSYDSYSWNTGQSTESISVGPFVAPGLEEVILEVTDGNCTGSDTLLITIDNCLGVEDNETVDLLVYPNPANDIIKVEVNEQVQGIRLFNVNGIEVMSRSKLNSGVLNVSELENGVYLLQVVTKNGLVHKKIQIIH